MSGPSGNSEFCFPSNLNVEVSGKQNSLFPLGPVIKCLLSKVNAALKLVFFFFFFFLGGGGPRVRKIKYLNKPEENKTDAANYLQTRRLRRTQY